MNDTARRRFRQTIAALVALGLVLSVLGPVGTVAAQPSVSVSQSADSTTIAPGETVTITTEFTVSELNAPQLSATTPDGWEIESQSATGPVAYNDGTWTWLAGDGDGVDVSYTVEYTVSVPEDADPGEYTISADGSALSPSDSSATSDSAATTVTVAEPDENEPPTASFTGSPDSPETGEQVSFDASGSTDDSTITSYEWDFGDGTTATGASPSHTYDSAGDYDVTLTVTDDEGDTDTETQTVSVSEAPDGDGPATTVSLSPENDLVAVDQSTEYDVVVDDADGGVGAYELTITVEDPSVASITDVELAGVSDEELTDVQIADDGSSVTIEAVLVDTEDDGSATLGTVTVQANAEGTSDLSLDVSDLGTEAGESYDVTGTNGASLTASTLVVGSSENPAQDLDGDGDYEDVNGDGAVDLLDVQTLFSDRDGPAVTNSPEAFDYNGDGEFTLSDIQALFAQETA